jgi:signal transduction histidine kinase
VKAPELTLIAIIPAGDAPGWAEVSEDGVRVTVSSPGARIAAGERDRLFERFYRGAGARTAHEGHGLGLALARHIARLHGGEAECASAPDEDARFVLRVPSWRGREVP